MQKDNFRIIFMGTPDFAVPSLSTLVENGFNVVAVITAPDRPSGRGRKLSSSPVKIEAEKHQIPVLQPEKLKAPEFLEKLSSYKADLQIVVAFRMLPEVVWNMPPLGSFNLHASLLPQYRGAAPINWAIINGEKETGITTFFLKHEIDTGDLLFQQTEEIKEEDDAGSLYNRLMHKGANLVVKTTEAILAGNYAPKKQVLTGDKINDAPKIFKETCLIHFDQPARKIYDFIRGLSPYPGAWCHLNDNFYKILKAKVLQEKSTKAPGFIETDEKTYLHIHTDTELISIEEIQAQGKRKMKTEEYFRGNKI